MAAGFSSAAAAGAGSEIGSVETATSSSVGAMEAENWSNREMREENNGKMRLELGYRKKREKEGNLGVRRAKWAEMYLNTHRGLNGNQKASADWPARIALGSLPSFVLNLGLWINCYQRSRAHEGVGLG